MELLRTLRKFNPGSTILLKKVDYSKPPTFERIYVSLDGMKNEFLASCRPYICLVGCFLKTPYRGQLLVAVVKDDNNNLRPIALALIPIENRETWTWFIGILLNDIGSPQRYRWTFMSDRQKGLIEALKDLAPDSEHQYCLRHMYENFKKSYKSLELKTLFWQATATANKTDFEMSMQKLETLSPEATLWLRTKPPQH